jgi:hypothetical protein
VAPLKDVGYDEASCFIPFKHHSRQKNIAGIVFI